MLVGAWVTFVRERGLAVVATTGPDGASQAALVGVAATDQGELIFDTSRSTRKVQNILRDHRAALVVGWDDEVTVQVEGVADVLSGFEVSRYQADYFAQYPDGRDRAVDPDIVYVRVRPTRLRRSDFRPGSFGVEEVHWTP